MDTYHIGGHRCTVQACPCRSEATVDVPCANTFCHHVIDARRAALGRVAKQDFALCPACNAANLVLTDEARELSPEYETAHFNAAKAADERVTIMRDRHGMAVTR